MAEPRNHEYGDRSAFLARAARSTPLHSFRPTVSLESGVPVAVPARPVADVAARFEESVSAMGAVFRRVGPGYVSTVADVLAELCAAEGVRTAVTSRDPECDGLATVLSAQGVEVRNADGPTEVAGVDLGVTGAAFGIALTGSVVVAADRAGSRTASLLPPVHVAMVRVGRLLATPDELFRHFPRRFPNGLPSNLVLITGPSRSADIELQLTLGVHGPRSLWVVLLG